MRQGTVQGVERFSAHPRHFSIQVSPPPHPWFHLTGKVLNRYKVDPALERFTLLHNNSPEESAVNKQGNLK